MTVSTLQRLLTTLPPSYSDRPVYIQTWLQDKQIVYNPELLTDITEVAIDVEEDIIIIRAIVV